MLTRFATTVLHRFRVVVHESGAQLESRSAAGVHRVRTADGLSAYLKVTPVTVGPQALAAARRELRFYRDIAPVAPVRTPGLLDHADTDDGVALLLEAAGEPRDVRAWTPAMWAALGRDLAALHSMPCPGDADWGRPDALRQALADPDLPAIEAFWSPALPRLGDLLSRHAELGGHMARLPQVFVHGDCHTDNITHSGEALVLCDWQETGIGRQVSDLAFLNVRAAPAGVTAPAALLDAYLDNHPCEHGTLRRALLAEELAVYLFQWPHYARYNSPSGIAHVRHRAGEVAEQWLDAAARH
jgi:Ser/Thr protein kinase RdoA (MazF antagonist)